MYFRYKQPICALLFTPTIHLQCVLFKILVLIDDSLTMHAFSPSSTLASTVGTSNVVK